MTKQPYWDEIKNVYQLLAYAAYFYMVRLADEEWNELSQMKLKKLL